MPREKMECIDEDARVEKETRTLEKKKKKLKREEGGNNKPPIPSPKKRKGKKKVVEASPQTAERIKENVDRISTKAKGKKKVREKSPKQEKGKGKHKQL